MVAGAPSARLRAPAPTLSRIVDVFNCGRGHRLGLVLADQRNQSLLLIGASAIVRNGTVECFECGAVRRFISADLSRAIDAAAKSS